MEEDIRVEIEEKKGVMTEEIRVNGSGRDYFLPISILAAGLMVSGSIIYLVGAKNSPGAGNTLPDAGGATPPAVAGAPQVSDRDVILGDPKAPVTLIEYGDYQCPFCGHFFTGAEASIRDQYVKTGRVKMVFKNFAFIDRFPGVPQGENESHDAAAAADCAKDQGKFWAYHDALFVSEIADGRENSGNLNRAEFLRLARNLNLDINTFTSCIDGKKYLTQIDKDTTEAQAAGVNSTPTTFVNGQKFQGALPFEQFQSVIESLLKSK